MDARDYRVGDADREYVAGMLQHAVSHGMLTLDEFSDRMDSAVAARTRGELHVVLEDLPGMDFPIEVPGMPPARPPSPSGHPVSGHPASGQDVLPLTATMTSINRTGHWVVPERVTIRSRFSNVVLDLTQAEVRAPVVTIEIDDICSSTDIIVPDSFTADIGSLRCLGCSANSKVDSVLTAGRVHLIVTGQMRFAALTVRHPFGTWLRKKLR